MSSSSLLGVYIENYGTIKQQYLELDSGLNVLYGLNGAGKSQILDCISKTISNDDVFSKLGGPFHFGQNPTLSSLVFEPSRNGAYFHENTRHWQAEFVPSFSHLPSIDDVLEAILGYQASEQIARRAESTQVAMHFELFDLKNESERIVRDTTSDGLLVLVPVPFSNTFQVIYCIKKNAESTIFQNAWRKLREAMTRAHLKYQETWEDDGEQHEIWPEALKGLEDSPVYNIFTLQGSLIDQTLYDWGTGWSSSLDHEGLLKWPMPFVPIASLGFVRHPPIRFIDESKDESLDNLSQIETSRMFGAAYQEYTKELYGEINKGNQNPPASYSDYKLSKEVQDKFSVDVSNSVNRILQSFMFGLPKPNFDVGAPDRWISSFPPVWKFSINDHEVGFESLSNVQKRFCKLAIQIDQHLAYTSFESEEDEDDQTEELPTLLIVDEPERGLNRTSEDYMAKGFADLEKKKIHSLVASHSPSFLNNGNARVNLVEISNIGTTIKPLKMMDTSNMSALGLRPGDLLQMYKVFWLVEGEHELAVFEELFRFELEKYKIKILPLRGIKSLASVADSSMLFEYTNAKILVTVDNVQNTKLNSAWTSAKEMLINKQPVNRVRGDLLRILDEKTGEVRKLLELMTSSLFSGNWDRLEFSSLTKKDLIEYFAPEAFNLKSDWATLRSQHGSQNVYPDFKEFLRATNGAQISTNKLVEACKTLDAIDPDWTECLKSAIKLSESQQ